MLQHSCFTASSRVNSLVMVNRSWTGSRSPRVSPHSRFVGGVKFPRGEGFAVFQRRNNDQHISQGCRVSVLLGFRRGVRNKFTPSPPTKLSLPSIIMPAKIKRITIKIGIFWATWNPTRPPSIPMWPTQIHKFLSTPTPLFIVEYDGAKLQYCNPAAKNAQWNGSYKAVFERVVSKLFKSVLGICTTAREIYFLILRSYSLRSGKKLYFYVALMYDRFVLQK